MYYKWIPDSSIIRIHKGWVPCVPTLFLLFTQNYLSEHYYSQTSLILLIAWNLSCYFRFAFSLFAWFIRLECALYLFHHYDYFGGLYVIFIVWTLLFIGGRDFQKIIEGRFENGGKHFFSLALCGVCASNALYSTSLSLRMFIVSD